MAPVVSIVHFIYHSAPSQPSNPRLRHVHPTATLSRADLEALWMPFTANRQFKSAATPAARRRAACTTGPRRAGRSSMPLAGLWCVNAGHGRREITQAVASSLETLDYAPTFQMGHPPAFAPRQRAGRRSPRRTRSRVLHQLGIRVRRHGAEDRARLPPRARRSLAHAPDRPRARLPRCRLRRHLGRRHRANRKMWSATLLPGVDHLAHTHDLVKNAFSRGRARAR